MSPTDTDLLDACAPTSSPGAARPDEQVEAYVVRARETDVEVFGGEVESLTTAVVEGVGVRVIADHRQGYAWAGSLEPTVVDDTLQDARDNAKFGEPDEWYALPGPADIDGVAARRARSLARRARRGADRREGRARARSRSGDQSRRRPHPQRRVDGLRRRARSRPRSRTRSAWKPRTRRTSCGASSVAIADDGTGPQTGYGYVAGRALADLDLASVPRDAATRACRLLGARPIAGRRIPVILDPLVTRSVLGVLASAFSGESVLKGRSLFAGREGEQIGAPIVTVLDDPTDVRASGASTYDSEGVPTRVNTLIAGGVLHGFLQNVYTGRRSGRGHDRQRARAASRRLPGSACARCASRRAASRPKRSWPQCRRRSTCSR